MRTLDFGIAVAAVCLILAPRAMAQGNPTPDQLPDQLIGQLAQIDCNGPGLYEYSQFEDFWAVIPESFPRGHLQRDKPDCMPDAMRALVRLGPQALPALVRHIDDARPAALTVGVKQEHPEVIHEGGQIFAHEYDPRAHVYDEDVWPGPFLEKCSDGLCFTGRGFDEPYTIRIGDICLVLIGQIVNRELVAARYQMTGWVVVNSPVETPSLAQRVRSDWAGVGERKLKDSLLADLHMAMRPQPPGHRRFKNEALSYEEGEAGALRDLYARALRRLRFYYPAAYAGLSGDDLVKQRAFEKEEVENARQVPRPDPETLIGKLTAIGCPLPGASDVAMPRAFLAQMDSMEHFSQTQFEDIKGYHVPVSCDTTPVLNLMGAGPSALPALLRHVDDARPTKLVLGRDLAGAVLAEEYDARDMACTGKVCGTQKTLQKPYTVKVGDLCFVLIGQLVNRQLVAAHVLADRVLVVNSPVSSPALAARVRADWAGAGDADVQDSLLADLRAGMHDAPETLASRRFGALRLLRFYFPQTYAALAGADLEKRKVFEAAERSKK
jgi:hypothetical protein